MTKKMMTRRRVLSRSRMVREAGSQPYAVKLSVADIDLKTGDVKPNEVAIAIGAIERLARSGKPGPFTRK
ncbi:MAG TPA: hypothetical protein VFE62_03810 [Gemmataceae bacterium]|nr:hypothetical protein [Gemmataceae bacterium]